MAVRRGLLSPPELLPTLAEVLDNLPLHTPSLPSMSGEPRGDSLESADESGASNRKFKGFRESTSTQLSIKPSSCRRQDLVSRVPARWGVVAIQGGRKGEASPWFH